MILFVIAFVCAVIAMLTATLETGDKALKRAKKFLVNAGFFGVAGSVFLLMETYSVSPFFPVALISASVLLMIYAMGLYELY